MTGLQLWALCILGLTYVAILSERVHRTIAAGVGAALMVVSGVLTQSEAFATLDLNTLGLLFGMMVQVSALKRSGFFEAVGDWAVLRANGQPWQLAVALGTLTALFSAFLDNVTTVLVMGPVALTVSRRLSLNPVPMLLCIVFASNIGGAATLVGDPPNVLIGSAAGISFPVFAWNLAPICGMCLVAALLYLRSVFRQSLRAAPRFVPPEEESPMRLISDRGLLYRSAAILSLTMVAFLFHPILHLELATIAIAGAAILLVWTRLDLGAAMEEVEWPTLLLLCGLFVVVGGVEKTGLLRMLAARVFAISGNRPELLAVAVLWMSAAASAVVDNIPFAVAMIPVISELARLLYPHAGPGDAVLLQPISMMLWWALALGSCLGGNATLFGASANLVTAGLAERAGYPIGFKQFLRVGLPLSFLTLVVASICLLAFFPRS